MMCRSIPDDLSLTLRALKREIVATSMGATSPENNDWHSSSLATHSADSEVTTVETIAPFLRHYRFVRLQTVRICWLWAPGVKCAKAKRGRVTTSTSHLDYCNLPRLWWHPLTIVLLSPRTRNGTTSKNQFSFSVIRGGDAMLKEPVSF